MTLLNTFEYASQLTMVQCLVTSTWWKTGAERLQTEESLGVSGCGYKLRQSERKQGERVISAFTVRLRRCGRKRRGSLRWVDFPGDANIWIIKTESDNWAERSDFCKPALSQQRRRRRYPGSTRLKLVCQQGTNERFPGGQTDRKQVLSFIWVSGGWTERLVPADCFTEFS